MNSKKYMYLGTVLVAGLLVVVSPQAQAQSQKTPQEVNIKQVGGTAVTNTVPVSGSVGITGTVPVSGSVGITGTVPVSGSVDITGTPSVNAAQSGVWNVGTQNRDSRARNYYQTHNLSCGYEIGICVADLAPVPAGKRLIIEHVSGEADMSGPNDLYRISLWAKNQWSSAYFEFGPARQTPNNLYAHAFNAGIFAAFNEGETPQLVFQSSGPGGFAWQAVVSGYLIDIP